MLRELLKMERDMDELSGKYIEASEKLEQWDLWWQEASTQAREAETTVRHPEGLTTIAEEERRQQPVTPLVQSQPTIPQEFLPPPLPPKFAHKNFPERANESDESSHTGMDPQALPTFAPTTPPSAPKHIPPAMTSAPPSPFAGPWAATRESCNPQIRSWITTLVPEVAESVTHLPCQCIHHPEWAMQHLCLLLLSLTLVQPWERRALHNKLVHHKVGSQAMKSGRIGHHYPSW